MRVSGLASNLDWEQLVEQLMQIERKPLLLLERRKLEIETEKNAWSDVRTRLSNLSSRIDDVLATDLFERIKATSSDESIVTVSASAAARSGTYTVQVTQLAQAHSIGTWTRLPSDSAPDPHAALGQSGTFHLDIVIDDAVQATFAITVDPGDSAYTIRDKINQEVQKKIASSPDLEPYGVRAEVIDGYLVITRTHTGEGTIEVRDVVGDVAQNIGLIDPDMKERELIPGRNAEITINGVSVSRPSNTITDVIPGVTLELHKADPGVTIKLTVAPNDDAVVDAIKKFIDQYNSVISFMNQQLDYKDPTGGKLGGDPLLVGLREELRRLVADPVPGLAGTPFDRLSAIGITTRDKTGALQLDEAKLREALSQDRAAVQRLLAGDPAAGGIADGVFARLEQRVESWLRANTGLLDTRIKSLADRAEDYADQIERMEYRLQLREQNMLRQFQALESLLSTLQSQESWLVQQINQLNSLWRPRR